MKLPHSFRVALEKRMEGVLRGTEKMPGYSDAAVKRTFGEAYTAFTANTFRKSIDKDRKLEPLILIFYTSGSKAQSRGKTAEDDSWKMLVDRHVALFVRLVSSVLRDQGSDQGRPELMGRLASLEKKLLTNDQDLYIDTGQVGERKTIEVEVPLTYEIKDMPMVQTVARLFGRPLEDVQVDIDRDLPVWTEEAALQDLKSYQHRLTANLPGALRRQDFGGDGAAFDEWKKTEINQLTQLMLDILRARPELAKTSSSAAMRPPSMYSSPSAGGGGDRDRDRDQAFADLSRMIVAQPDGDTTTTTTITSASIGGNDLGADGSFGFSALSLVDGIASSTAVDVEDLPDYTFIPPDTRAYYKFVLRQALTHDLQHPPDDDAGAGAGAGTGSGSGSGSGAVVSEAVPLLRPSMDLLIELATHWRLPQSARSILLLDVAAQRYQDGELAAEAVYEVFEDVKLRASVDHLAHNKKAPHIQLFGSPLQEVPRSRWPLQDLAAYRQILGRMFEAMLRELLEVAAQCYDAKPRSIGPSLLFIRDHVQADEAFSERPEVVAQFAEALTSTLWERAAAAYRDFLDKHIPQLEDDWDFSHVVDLGKAVVGLCERTRKRYRKNPEIMGVSPFDELVVTVFPSFEQDAQAIVERVMQVAKGRGQEVNVQDGFDLYRELVAIRKIHVESLPAGRPFAFHVEGLLEDFVWRWIRGAQERMEHIVEEAIRQDQFQARPQREGDVPTDEERHSVSIVDTFQAFNQSVDQIYQLEWDDDVHHARFMTALASAFTAGIGRYCEIVEQRFVGEMDRPSEQELSAASKTAQERWMQYAKDALSSKDKVEPFQFYPEVSLSLSGW